MPDSALAYLDKFERLAVESNSPPLLADNKRRYMRVYTKIGDKEKALRYQEEYFAHQDSMLNPNRFLNVSGRYHKENEDRADMIIRNLRQTVANQKLLLIVILFSIAFMITLLFFRHKSRMASIQLFRRNRELVEIEEKVRTIEECKHISGPIHSIAEDAAAKDAGQDDDRKALFDKIVLIMTHDTSWCDPEFSLNRLVEIAESNTKYVSQAINEHTGKNFRSFINEYRIREARRSHAIYRHPQRSGPDGTLPRVQASCEGVACSGRRRRSGHRRRPSRHAFHGAGLSDDNVRRLGQRNGRELRRR